MLRRKIKACCLHLEDSTLPFYETLIKLRCLVAVSATVSTAVSATAVITMNERLLHAPMECTEYIMVHELAHLVRADHSPAFHAVVTEVMPDWKERKKRLREAKIPL